MTEEPGRSAEKARRVDEGQGGDIGLGVVTVLVAGVTTAGLGTQIFLPAAVAIGVFQLIYVVPLMVWAYTQDRPGIIKGAAIMAALIFLVNAACFGLVASSF